MIPLGTWPRFLSALVCLLATAMALNLRSAREAVVPQTNLAYFPHTINGWNGTDLGLSSDEVATLGPGQFLLRDYDRPNPPTVTLFLAYYPSQQTGDTMYSPKNRLPGSGWEPTNSGVIQLLSAGGRQIDCQPLHRRARQGSHGGLVLVSGARPYRGQRVLGKMAAGAGRNRDESDGRGDGARSKLPSRVPKAWRMPRTARSDSRRKSVRCWTPIFHANNQAMSVDID